MTIVPVAMFKVVLVKNSGLRHSEARAISFGIFVTIALIFFLPVAIWKFMVCLVSLDFCFVFIFGELLNIIKYAGSQGGQHDAYGMG
jgi:hypothetical protein